MSAQACTASPLLLATLIHGSRVADRSDFLSICRWLVYVMGGSTGDDQICFRKPLACSFWKCMGRGVVELAVTREGRLLFSVQSDASK